MAFRLPANLGIGQEYTAVNPGDVTALEEALPASSRMLVGLVFSKRYEGFEEDCERANEALLAQPGLLTWPECPEQFVTPDADGNPIAWIHYQSSPSWWMIILITLGGIFLLPILSVLPVWIIDLMFPGLTELLTLGIIMFIMFLVIRPMTKSLTEGETK